MLYAARQSHSTSASTRHQSNVDLRVQVTCVYSIPLQPATAFPQLLNTSTELVQETDSDCLSAWSLPHKRHTHPTPQHHRLALIRCSFYTHQSIEQIELLSITAVTPINLLHACTSLHAPPVPHAPVDIWAVMIVWRPMGKIIGTFLCSIVYCKCVQTYEQFLQWTMAC